MKYTLPLVFLFAVTLSAQGPTAIPGATLVWDQPNATAPEAQGFTYRYYPDGATTGVVLGSVLCGGSPVVTCAAPFPAFTPGSHTLTLSAGNLAGEGPKSVPLGFVFVVAPSAPVQLRIGSQ